MVCFLGLSARPVGYGIAVATQVAVFPLFGLHVSVFDNLTMGAVFTLVSIIRSYLLRRLFEAIRLRQVSESYQDGDLVKLIPGMGDGSYVLSVGYNFCKTTA